MSPLRTVRQRLVSSRKSASVQVGGFSHACPSGESEFRLDTSVRRIGRNGTHNLTHLGRPADEYERRGNMEPFADRESDLPAGQGGHGSSAAAPILRSTPSRMYLSTLGR